MTPGTQLTDRQQTNQTYRPTTKPSHQSTQPRTGNRTRHQDQHPRTPHNTYRTPPSTLPSPSTLTSPSISLTHLNRLSSFHTPLQVPPLTSQKCPQKIKPITVRSQPIQQIESGLERGQIPDATVPCADQVSCYGGGPVLGEGWWGRIHFGMGLGEVSGVVVGWFGDCGGSGKSLGDC